MAEDHKQTPVKPTSSLGQAVGARRSAFFWMPGLGPLLVAGPLVSWIVGALEGAALVGGLSALGAGLYGLGIPKDSIVRYETAVKSGKFLLVAHGDAADLARAKGVLDRTRPEVLEHHRQTAQK